MPKVKKIQPIAVVNQTFSIPKQLMQQIDMYKALTNADSRNAVINEIITHYFDSSGDISPAMQKVLRKFIPAVPSPENAERLLALLMSDVPEEEVARAFMEAMSGMFTNQIAVMRAALRQAEEMQGE
jgi:hypothetical protein